MGAAKTNNKKLKPVLRTAKVTVSNLDIVKALAKLKSPTFTLNGAYGMWLSRARRMLLEHYEDVNKEERAIRLKYGMPSEGLPNKDAVSSDVDFDAADKEYQELMQQKHELDLPVLPIESIMEHDDWPANQLYELDWLFEA